MAIQSIACSPIASSHTRPSREDAPGVVLAREARVVQGHNLPLVIVDGRSGRPGVGVRLIVKELVPGLGDLQHEVLAQGDLLRLTVGMLDDGHALARQDLPGRRTEAVVPEFADRPPVVRHLPARYEGKVQLGVRAGEEEGIRVEQECGGSEQPAVGAALVVKLHRHETGRPGGNPARGCS